jgi:ribosomal protein S27AE
MTPETRTAVLERDNHKCVRCGDSIMFARVSVHHRKLRAQGGTDDPTNLITLCGSGNLGCHGLVHSRRKDIGELFGYIVASWQDPATVPVRTPAGLVMLTADYLRVSA